MTENRHNSGSTALSELFRVRSMADLEEWHSKSDRDNLSTKESKSRNLLFNSALATGAGLTGMGAGLLACAFGIAAAPVVATCGAVAALGAGATLLTQKLAVRASEETVADRAEDDRKWNAFIEGRNPAPGIKQGP